MGVEAQRYHGWWVLAVPQQGYWTAEYYRSPKSEICVGDVAFERPLEAINAAKSIVDQALSKTALLCVLDHWLEVDMIDEQEYRKLVQSVYEAGSTGLNHKGDY